MTLPVPICDSLLTAEDSATLYGMGDSIAHAMRVRQIHRTETEMRISVLDAIHYPTPASRYFQAVREQCVMVGEMTRLFFDMRKANLARKRAQAVIEDPNASAFDKEEAQITVDEFDLNEQFRKLEAADRAREIRLWETIKNEQIETDPTFDRDNVDSHQLVSYTVRFILRAQISDASKMTGGELDNLLGQLRAGVALAQKRGVMPTVLSQLSPDAAELVRAQLLNNPVPVGVSE